MIRSVSLERTALVLWVVLAAAAGSAEEPAPAPYSVEPLLTEIRARQAELDRRERDLDDRQRTLAELEEVVDARLAEIGEIQELVENRVTQWEEQSGERIGQLARIYAAMPPARAARLIDALDANLATQILRKMKHKNSAALLARISKERALVVSRQVAHPLSFEPAETDGEDL